MTLVAHARFSFSSFPEEVLTPKTPGFPAPRRSAQGRGFKIMTPKQTLQRLSILYAQVQAGNTK